MHTGQHIVVGVNFGFPQDSSLKTSSTSDLNSRPYKINTTKAVAITSAMGEKNQAIAAKADVVQGSYLPGTIILDKQHRVAAKFIGPVNKEDLSRILNQLASE